MIDRRGFRLNVGIILANDENRLFWGKRPKYKNAWQFPQGGVNPYETLKETMYRELTEETGLSQMDVSILGITKRWLYYRLPHHFQRRDKKPLCIGQKQKWFLLRLITNETKISLNNSPEFVDWQWVDYWYPLGQVISFKREVYRKALVELRPFLLTYSETKLE
ncbi:MAG: RNA pyrophosphohydrolase [Coxiella sp. DG_40]|nr:MAG: RNA pyrophosphohydrolase [Coxiella sp. DG_40]